MRALEISQDGTSFQPQNNGQPFSGIPTSLAQLAAAIQ
jgi:hypothetical protein